MTQSESSPPKETTKKARISGRQQIHIYSQEGQGDCACILGTSKGLQQLRDLIDNVLANPKGSGVLEARSSDGKSYDILVVTADDDWSQKAVPYHGKEHRERRPNIHWPWDIVIDRIPKTPGG